MAKADSIENILQRLGNQVLAIHGLVQIISQTTLSSSEPGASFELLLDHHSELLSDAFYALEATLKEKISATEVANG